MILADEARRLACPGFYIMPQAADGRLCRLKLSGRVLHLPQLRALAACAERYGSGVIELTTRGSIQLRGIKDSGTRALGAALARAGLAPPAPQADGINNIMLNPAAGLAPSFWGAKAARQARASAAALRALCAAEPRLQRLSPKFSFYFDGGELCAVPEHKNDIWLSFLPPDDKGEALCLIGLCSSLPRNAAEIAENCLGLVRYEEALAAVKAALEAFLSAAEAHKGLSRMKHWRAAQSMSAIRAALPARFAAALRPAAPAAAALSRIFSARAEAARAAAGGLGDTDFAMRALALGAHKTGKSGGSAYLGAAPPLGRFSAASLRRFAQTAAEALPEKQAFRLTAQQSLIFAPCSVKAARRGALLLAESGFISGRRAALAPFLCCAGAPYCLRAKADVQADALRLAGALGPAPAARGMIHLTGCGKSCAATDAKFFTLLALDSGHYAVYKKEREETESRFGRLIAAKLPLAGAAELLRRQES